jgi:hypothetical protein
VLQWFKQRLPNTGAIVRRTNHALRTQPIDPQRVAAGRFRVVPLPAEAPFLPFRGADAPLAGTALDLLVRATLRRNALRGSRVATGASRLSIGNRLPPAIFIAVEAMDRIDSPRPDADPGGVDWEELATLVVLVARFEQASRSDAAVMAVRSLVTHAEETLDGYRTALVDPHDVADVAHAGPLVAADLADLRSKTLNIGPSFALSRDLGGADADLLADRTLFDFKASSTKSPVNREAIWQIAGYALADLDDKYHIAHLGVCALRWRTRAAFPLQDALDELAGAAVDIAELRAEFGDAIRNTRR